MRLIVIFISIFLTQAFAFDCESEFLKEAKELMALDHQGILSKQFELTTLKLSMSTLKNNKTNFEALVRKYQRSLDKSDPAVLTKLEELYQKYGIQEDYQKILDNFSAASYWNRETRFFNQDVSMFILAVNTLSPDKTDLNKKDAAITWFASKLSNSLGKSNSTSFNLSNISSHVASITGSIKGQKKKSIKQIESGIKKLKQAIEKDFKELKNDLSFSFKENCLDEDGKILSCSTEDDLFSSAIRELSQSVGDSKIYQFNLEGSVIKNFKGRVNFKVRTNLKEYAKQDRWRQRSDKLPKTLQLPEGFEVYAQKKKWQRQLNQLTDINKIKAYNEEMGKSNFGILDKSKAVLSIYSKQSVMLASMSVNLEGPHQDEKSKSGSGIYKVTNSLGSLSLTDQRNNITSISYANNTLDCSKGETCHSDASSDELIAKFLMPDGTLYIIPYDGINHFEVKNSVLNLTTNRKTGPYHNTNYSPKNKRPTPIKIAITDHRYKTKTSRQFIRSIENEKSKIMQLYKLDSDEYNDLAKYAFGIMGNESDFGENWRYDLKEAFPFAVAFTKETKKNVIDKTISRFKKKMKSAGFWPGVKQGVSSFFKELIKRDVRLLTGKINTKENSRGPTQIKNIPTKIKKHYKINKDNISLPRNSAIATIGFLAESMVELKARAKNNPNITKENRLDYLHYIYMGSSHEIRNRTATPEKNIYLRQLKRYMKGIKIYQKVAN